MPYAILSNGKTVEMDYNQAAKVQEVLNGDREPDNEEQAAFCLKVQAVHFEALPAKKTFHTATSKEPDEKLKGLVNDSKIKGYAKFVSIGNHLKKRNAS